MDTQPSVHHSPLDQHEPVAESSHDEPLLPEELCKIPTFLHTKCCPKHLIEETRCLIKERYQKRPGIFQEKDYELMLADDWAISRFLLRCRSDPKRAASLIEECGRLRRECRMGISEPEEFPIEFHRTGALFHYAPDRVGNQTLYVRAKMYLPIPEMLQAMKEFGMCCLERADCAGNGRGIAVIVDFAQCGFKNLDLSLLFWGTQSARNCFPKGVSYIIVYNLPWIFRAFAKLAISQASSTNRRRLRFLTGNEIKEFIAPENLPDFLGGTCELSYRDVPKGARPAEEVALKYNLTREQARKIKKNYIKFLKQVEVDIDWDELMQPVEQI